MSLLDFIPINLSPQKEEGSEQLKVPILNFINCLYGSYFKIKEIHFNTTNQSKHELSDEFSSSLFDLADKIFENFMGIYERCGYNLLEPNIPNTTDLKEIMVVLRKRLNNLLSIIGTKTEFGGLCNILNDYQETLNKYIYLSDNR